MIIDILQLKIENYTLRPTCRYFNQKSLAIECLRTHHLQTYVSRRKLDHSLSSKLMNNLITKIACIMSLRGCNIASILCMTSTSFTVRITFFGALHQSITLAQTEIANRHETSRRLFVSSTKSQISQSDAMDTNQTFRFTLEAIRFVPAHYAKKLTFNKTNLDHEMLYVITLCNTIFLFFVQNFFFKNLL